MNDNYILMENIKKRIEENGFESTNWDTILSQYSKLEPIIELYIEKFNKSHWILISGGQDLSEKFIEKYKDKIEWTRFSQFSILDESIIEKYCDLVDWWCISTYQNLSEEFIKKYFNKLDVRGISYHQNLSEEFIINNIDKLDINMLKLNPLIDITNKVDTIFKLKEI
ncbi:tryptophan repeat gene family protein [Bacillus phage vB_BpuM-BpSp]|nr:tryptophan repeat gene family protein [Bacillus phage vB_BpuM-BpSp]